MRDLIVAVDIGTGSARAGVFDRSGTLLGRAEHPIAMRRPSAELAEHDSEDIWRAVCAAVKAACKAADAPAERVAAFGVDATCSLVVRDTAGKPLAVSGGAHWKRPISARRPAIRSLSIPAGSCRRKWRCPS